MIRAALALYEVTAERPYLDRGWPLDHLFFDPLRQYHAMASPGGRWHTRAPDDRRGRRHGARAFGRRQAPDLHECAE